MVLAPEEFHHHGQDLELKSLALAHHQGRERSAQAFADGLLQRAADAARAPAEFGPGGKLDDIAIVVAEVVTASPTISGKLLANTDSACVAMSRDRKLKDFFKKGMDATSTRVQHACVMAAANKQETSVGVFLERGVPLTCSDREGKKLIHTCVRNDMPKSIALLVTMKADFRQCIKELLIGGASVPHNAEMPGLANIVLEVQLQQCANEIRPLAKSEVKNAEILEAERAAQQTSAALVEELSQRRIEVRNAETELSKLRKEMSSVLDNFNELKEEDAKVL
eukprot:g10281.t1